LSTQLWKAKWVEDGRRQEFVFQSVNSLMIARIDFRLKYPHAFKDGVAPENYELEETNYAVNQPTQPTLLAF